MLKYVAIMKVDKPDAWSEWHSGPTAHFYKSPVETDKTLVEKWLKEELEHYPDARINCSKCDREYLIYTTIVAFDCDKSNDVELFLEHGPFFSSIRF